MSKIYLDKATNCWVSEKPEFYWSGLIDIDTNEKIYVGEKFIIENARGHYLPICITCDEYTANRTNTWDYQKRFIIKNTEMIIIENKYIPPKGFKAFNFFSIIFKRNDSEEMTEINRNHELIHTRQGNEMLWLPFYIWYVIEYLVRILQYGKDKAYVNISFEREAYTNEINLEYLKNRNWYESFKYLKR